MLYPFTHKIIGKIDNLNFTFDESGEVARDTITKWELMPIYCPAVTTWINTLPDLKTDRLYFSGGISHPWHIDNSKFFAVAGHRILIPLTDNFVWQFILKDGTVETVNPVIGNIYIFNNMIQHRFVSEEKRGTIFFDLYDTKLNSELVDKVRLERFVHV